MFFGSDQYRIHKIASLIILIAVLVSSLQVVLKEGWDIYGDYYLMFLGSAGFDVLSHGLKESLVRGTPINVTKFNLNISIAQLIAGFVMSPILLAINKQCVNYPLPPLSKFKTAAFHEFYRAYFVNGMKCAYDFTG